MQDYEKARELLAELMLEHAIKIDALFVPWSKSRNAKPRRRMNDLSLNWRITLLHDGRPVYTSDYSAGIGHCPAYKSAPGLKTSIYNFDRITTEVETGQTADTRKPIYPDSIDVLSSLLQDSDAIDYPRFEDWADSYGYEPDSRKAEETYRACLACGLALRAAFGDALLQELRELAHRL